VSENTAIGPNRTRTSRRLILGIILSCALIAAVSIVGALFGIGTSTDDRIRAAVDAKDWSRVVSLTDHNASPRNRERARIRMRALFRLGRRREAEVILRGLKTEDLQAEDLLVLGQSLINGDEVALGWVALEAASKLDPRSSETIAYMSANRASRRDLGGSAAHVDRLAALTDGRALAELVIGLALNDSPKRGASSTSLQQLPAVDPEDLHRVNSPAAARKLVARLLLEEGRAEEAIERLKSNADIAADPEAHWLLSRAYLATGRTEEAIDELHRSDGFNKDKPLTREAARFVGARRCSECHRAIYQTQQSSRHAETIARGAELQSVKLPKDPVPDPVDKRVTHRFERQGDKIEVTTTVDRERYRALVDFALGSGHHGQTMLARDDPGGHRSLRISYYSGGEKWDLTEKFRPDPTDGRGFLGDVLGEKEFVACLNCHTTRYTATQTQDSPELADHGIGCERCHGPGELHLRAIETSFPEPVIARPRLATPVDRMKLCGRCHAANGEIPPSDPRFIRFQATTLAYSRCYTESQGRLDCVTCHNPHRNVETAPASYERKCLACHMEGRTASPAVDAKAGAGLVCSVDPRKGCIGCHMPKDSDAILGSTFTDHHIRIHTDRSSPDRPH
jgi:tetratricopeptide (TPR) repeat protein